MSDEWPPITMEVVTDPDEIARTAAEFAAFERNCDWLEAHASEVYSHRGKFICIAGQELFVGDDLDDVLARAKRRTRMTQGSSRALFPREGGLVFMRIDGSWKLCEDGVLRPVFLGKVRASDGSLIDVWFLADTGADRTVFSADILRELNVQPTGPTLQLEGVGGQAASVVVDTVIVMKRDDGAPVHFNGRFAAVTDPGTLDMSVLGREITNLFAVIVDRPGDVVCLLGAGHHYQIVPGAPAPPK